MSYKLYHGDCLEVARDEIADGTVDLVLTDFPYGTTQCVWDTIIPFEPMWEQIKRVRKQRAAVVLFGSEPFSSLLRVSNLGEYKYDWVWEKSHATGFLDVQRKPMKQHEIISVFYDKQPIYNPQLYKKHRSKIRSGVTVRASTESYGKFKNDTPPLQDASVGFPLSIQYFASPYKGGASGFHPTQKPVALLRYLIRTYTNAGDTVLDFTMGSGSTGVAAILENRNFIGIDNGHCEKEGLYHGWRWVDVARERIANAAGEFTPTAKEKASGQMALWGGD